MRIIRIALIVTITTLWGVIGVGVAGGVTRNSQFLPSQPIRLVASWYSIQSLKNEGTYKLTKGRCANGSYFQDDRFTVATRLFPLGSWLLVTNLANGKSVKVKVTDRIGKRFAKTRIDLSSRAFSIIANLSQGIVSCKVERIK